LLLLELGGDCIHSMNPDGSDLDGTSGGTTNYKQQRESSLWPS
jgi:hypothetical protein